MEQSWNPIAIWRDWCRDLNLVDRFVVVSIFVVAVYVVYISPALAAVGDAPNNQAVWIALIAAMPIAAASLLVPLINERSRRRDRVEDLAEREAVAKRAEAATTRQLEAASRAETAAKGAADATRSAALHAADAARLLEEHNAVVAASTAETQAQLVEIKKQGQEIHVLVNSNLTAAKQATLEALEAKLIAQRLVETMREATGNHTSMETLADMDATSTKIAELKAELADRLKQTETAAQIAKS